MVFCVFDFFELTLHSGSIAMLQNQLCCEAGLLLIGIIK